MRILYLGPISGTCLDRANAYRRLGHEVCQIDLRAFLPRSRLVDACLFRGAGGLLGSYLRNSLGSTLRDQSFDLCHVDGGEFCSPRVLRYLRRYTKYIVNYNIDDPFGRRDGLRFLQYRKAVSEYDLLVVVRTENVVEAQVAGANQVLRVYRSADEISHAPRNITTSDFARWRSDILFVGTWMEDRGKFFAELIRRGLPLTIYGSRWSHAPEWSVLKPFIRGGHLDGEDYAMAIQTAKINIGLLSQGNRDLHTTRSLEIPSLGGLLCAPRTLEHTELYEDGREAVFWSSVEECASLCEKLLGNDNLRQEIKQNGRAKFLLNGHSNEKIMQEILSTVFEK